MKKKNIIIMILIFGSLLLCGYLFYSAKKVHLTEAVVNAPIEKNQEEVTALNKMEMDRLKIDYSRKTGVIINNCLDGIASKDLARLDILRSQLLDLTIPPEYKKYHLKLILLLSSANELLADKNDVDSALMLVTQAKDQLQKGINSSL